jgi:hypothetical protein
MIWMRRSSFCRALLAGALLLMRVEGKVVINEVFYHAPNGIEDLQWIELYNTSKEPADVSGWALTKGVRYTFPVGTRIPGEGYWVLSRNAKRFEQFYHKASNAEFEKTLRRKGERLELSDGKGNVVETLKFDDHNPWPAAADGLTASMERICPEAPAGLPENWASSTLSETPDLPSGTPGQRNSAHSSNLPPVVHHLTYAPLMPKANEPIQVDVQVEDSDGIKEAALVYQVFEPGKPSTEATVPLKLGADRRFSAILPGQVSGRLIRFWIRAVDTTGATRRFPGANEPRPAFSTWVAGDAPATHLAVARLIHLDPAEFSRAQGGGAGGMEAAQMRWNIQNNVRMFLDLDGLWCDLVLRGGMSVADLAALRPLFETFVTERDALIRDAQSSADLANALQSSIQAAMQKKTAIQQVLQPKLGAREKEELTAWMSGMPSRRGGTQEEIRMRMRGENMLRRVLRLEPGFAAFSRRKDLSEEGLRTLRTIYREGMTKRDELLDVAGAVRDAESYQTLMEKVGVVMESVDGQIKRVASSEQYADVTKALEEDRAANSFVVGRGRPNAAGVVQGRSAMIWYDADSKEPKLFDYISIAERKAGYKVRLQRDHPLNGMSAINLIFEDNERMVMAEPLALEFYRMAGLPASLTDFVQVYLDEAPLGYHLLIEQPNASFFRRNGLPENGDVFKYLWFEQGISKQHEKKNNPHRGHEELLQLIDQLGKLSGADQWLFIKKHFDVEQVINYFAVNMLLAHWDGFMNNFFAYHDFAGTGRWMLLPWDQDKTWGLHDGLGQGEIFATLPLTYGRSGDLPPNWTKPNPPKSFFETMNIRGSEWWRPPGYFSGPLLQNPVFRAHFVSRIKELLETDFTEERLFPKFEATRERLKKEVLARAKLKGEDEAEATARFEQNVDSFKRFVRARREYLLAQSELKGAAAFDRTQLK